jgi:hypothetical protein
VCVRPAGTATETDRAYVVERDLTKKDELDALIAGLPPMPSSA